MVPRVDRAKTGAKRPPAARTTRAQIVLTVSESKRLIACALRRHPVVSRALAHGSVIITRGTTNTYVVEELAGARMKRGEFVAGRVSGRTPRLWTASASSLAGVVLRHGKAVREKSLDSCLADLGPEDVVIKGGNALNLEERLVGVMVGDRCSGTMGKLIPHVIGKKAQLVIPIGLEKQVAGSLWDVARTLAFPAIDIGEGPALMVVTGHIVTEIEALEILAGVRAQHVASGGVDGAEGAVRLVLQGSEARVRRALRVIDRIRGEEPWVTEC